VKKSSLSSYNSFNEDNSYLYASRNDSRPFNNLIPFGVMEYRLFLIGFIFPLFAGISILSTYPARFSLVFEIVSSCAIALRLGVRHFQFYSVAPN
jgi:hypothetical protein